MNLIVELGIAETTMVARVVGEGAFAFTSSATLATVSTWAIVSRFSVAEVVGFESVLDGASVFAELVGVDGVEVGAVDELLELDGAELPPDPPPEADEPPAPHNSASPVS